MIHLTNSETEVGHTLVLIRNRENVGKRRNMPVKINDMKAYFAIKFKEDGSNKELIERLSKKLEEDGIQTVVFYRDYENWGEKKFESKELMRLAQEATDSCDAVVIEFSEKGVGLGIEAGYACAKGKPIHVIAVTESEISDTLRGIATSITFYNLPETLDTTNILR